MKIGLWLIVLSLLTQFGAISVYIDVFRNFIHLTLVIGLLFLFVDVCSKYIRNESAVYSLVGIFLSAILMVLYIFSELFSGVSEHGVGEGVKIVSYNMNHENERYQAISNWLISEAADFVVLIEADKKIIDILSPMYPHNIDCLEGKPLCSTVIFSRKRPISIDTYANGDPENRGALSAVSAEFCFTGEIVSIMAVHLSRPILFDVFKRDIEQLKVEINGTENDYLILAGDFNLTPWSFQMRKLEKDANLVRAEYFGATWPSNHFFPAILPIDHIFSSVDLTLQSIRLGPSMGSDHKSLVATYLLSQLGGGDNCV